MYGVKIDVKRRGCNGYSYVMDYVKKEDINKMDEVVEDKGVKVVIDNRALLFVVGTEMDFIDNEIKSEFVFNNPNAKGTCGCGESFHVWYLHEKLGPLKSNLINTYIININILIFNSHLLSHCELLH